MVKVHSTQQYNDHVPFLVVEHTTEVQTLQQVRHRDVVRIERAVEARSKHKTVMEKKWGLLCGIDKERTDYG